MATTATSRTSRRRALRWLSEQAARQHRYGANKELGHLIALLLELRDLEGFTDALSVNDILDAAQGVVLGLNWAPDV